MMTEERSQEPAGRWKKSLLFLVIVIFALVVLVFMLVPGMYPAGGTGILEGNVSIGPLCPVEPCNVSPDVLARAYEARKVVVTPLDQPGGSRTVQIGPTGHYEVVLPAGTYRVDINRPGIDRSADVPATVTIHPGARETLDISIDTGIR
ncbi:hypothetical protein J2741_002532 [Methanolinea mesophila]|uniref:hypothetical protein n=1 Tax=Methanolinea mesophila TaxID=547055 RepID=UPI001AEAEF2D|nr:hypothetical protein [Methanolinea mesophila]MBP1929936.1 hypothetical protein [Methanolinea mesophila]